jgi:hypothetical protein
LLRIGGCNCIALVRRFDFLKTAERPVIACKVLARCGDAIVGIAAVLLLLLLLFKQYCYCCC